MPSRITLLDVGHGNAAIVENASGVKVFDVAQGSSLLEFLKSEGVTRLDAVVLSHADADHIGGLIQILAVEDVEVVTVYLNSDASKGSTAWDDLAWELDNRSGKGEIKVVGSITRDLGRALDCGEIGVEILGPRPYLALKGVGGQTRAKERIRSNTLSVVVRLVRRGRPLALLPGDLDSIGLESLEEDGVDLRADVLVYPHHGGGSGTSAVAFASRLCSLVKPSVVIFSIGRGRFGMPNPEVVGAVRRIVPEVRIACTQLSHHCSERLPATEPQHLLSVFSQGRRTGKCCAGSMVLNVGGSGEIEVYPDHIAHEAFIDGAAPTALCRRSH